MTYYDELGVSPSASSDEIRQAYRELARLLHPDQQQDEALRRAAERQMKRLNHVVAVLTDPVERRRYDLNLRGGPVVRLAAARLLAMEAAQAVRRCWVWVATAGVAATGLAYYFSSHQAPVRVDRAELTAPTAPAESSPRPKTRPRAPRVMKNSPQRRRSAPKETLALEPPPQLSTPAPLRAVAAAPAAVSAPPPPIAPDTLAGAWLYAPPRLPERHELVYPPEYIELRIIEESGVLFGRYRARYRVTDRALWPEVSFEFEGEPGQETFAWRGSGGARGEVRLKRAGAARLEVTWWASELSERLSLASGTAVLVREATPAKEVR